MLIIQVINLLFQVAIYMILGRAIMSWFVRPGDKLFVFYRRLCQLTDPFLAPFQKISYRFGMNSGIDISSLLALVVLWFLQSVVIKLLYTLLY